MSALEDAVTAIRRDYIGDDYVSRVKASVSAELRALDPTVEVEDTRYFNHSAIPDFVLSWPKDRLKRDVYIRGSYASILTAQDVTDLPANDPVFMALDKTQEFPDEPTPITPARIQLETTKARATLLTDVGAVGSLREVGSSDRSSGPLAALVQSNFVRGARGLVDDDRADELISTERADGRTTISEVLRETFSEETFLRMERTAAIIDLAMASPADTVAEPVNAAKLAGRLSDAEISAVLPWVLSNEDIDPPASFWANLGALIEFEDLEKVAARIEGVDISRFVAANANRWRVKRGYVGTLDYSDPDRVARVWHFINGTLTVDADYHRVSMSTRALRGRKGAQLPRWSELVTSLADFRLQTVALAGVDRSVVIDAAQSDDIRADTQKLTTELVDDWHVQTVKLRFLAPQLKRDVSDVAVDMAKRLATADDGVAVEEMLRSCLRVVAHRNPVTLQEIALFTSVERAGEGDEQADDSLRDAQPPADSSPAADAETAPAAEPRDE